MPGEKKLAQSESELWDLSGTVTASHQEARYTLFPVIIHQRWPIDLIS